MFGVLESGFTLTVGCFTKSVFSIELRAYPHLPLQDIYVAASLESQLVLLDTLRKGNLSSSFDFMTFSIQEELFLLRFE